MQLLTSRSRIRVTDASSLLGLQMLTAVLSLTAGSLDVITYLGLGGLFSAHITGNIVLLAANVAIGGTAQLAPMLSVPMFIAMLLGTSILARGLETLGYSALRPLLLLQFLLLAAFLILAIADRPEIDTTTVVATLGGMLGVSAMAVQNALVQVSLKGAPGTAVMTTNIARFALDICTLLLRIDRAESSDARRRAGRTWPSIAGFSSGCAFGALCEARLGLLSLMLPTAFSLVALVLAIAGACKPDHQSGRFAEESAA